MSNLAADLETKKSDVPRLIIEIAPKNIPDDISIKIANFIKIVLFPLFQRGKF